MALRVVLLALLLSAARLALANIEKAVFLGPAAVNIPAQHAALGDLHLSVLAPGGPSLRTRLAAEFSKNESDRGTPSWAMVGDFGKPHWIMLDNLREGQRYELRLCWSAAQPSSFRIRTHELPAVLDTPALITSLSEYSHARQYHYDDNSPRAVKRAPTRLAPDGDREASVLFLQIFAAADFFSMNQTLMEHPPPIHVHISLDPYLFNMIPHALIPVIGYIAVIVVISFAMGRRTLAWLRVIAASPAQKEKKAQ